MAGRHSRASPLSFLSASVGYNGSHWEHGKSKCYVFFISTSQKLRRIPSDGGNKVAYATAVVLVVLYICSFGGVGGCRPSQFDRKRGELSLCFQNAKLSRRRLWWQMICSQLLSLRNLDSNQTSKEQTKLIQTVGYRFLPYSVSTGSYLKGLSIALAPWAQPEPLDMMKESRDNGNVRRGLLALG